MANVAVYAMNMGQPALLYLVPCTLGTMSYMGWKRQELRQLWDGPRVLSTADDIVYGPPSGGTENGQELEGRSPSSSKSHEVASGGEATFGEQGDGIEEGGIVDDEMGGTPLLSTSQDIASSGESFAPSRKAD